MKKFFAIACLLAVSVCTFSQKNKSSKYQSLMWEITGNGLKKPSYLFGTMHVSSKMVFHLSDSFYNAISRCDAVSLELNPQVWQPEMFRMEQAQLDMQNYNGGNINGYLTEKSFRLNDYDDKLKRALNEEPTQVNGLLYRTYQAQADFEENTYLDLYIYQTGRKLGKQAAGVEDFLETEKLIMEAYQDAAKEKKKKKVDTDGESYYEIQKKLQEAYRRGDLDLMDSLDKMTATSDAFNEKFIYKRNEIQANSIDTIIKKQSLFVGVGAAHLPGERGVIELLRKKGYKLRPVKMFDRDAEQKDKIDKMKVPVVMKPTTTDDGFIKLALPGEFYKRGESRMNESWQYADMENGTYYMLTRVKTHAGILGQQEKDVMNKVDSLLYENIPGKILNKKVITKNGYNGYDITNKTRRGDIQRYNVLITPYEVLIFKMSGNDDYVNGKEADDFFNSIQLKEYNKNWVNYQPVTGGFKAFFPKEPNISLNKSTVDRIDTWEYEVNDDVTGDNYAIWKKSLNNYHFIEEDSFDLSLMEESLLRSEQIEKQISRKFTVTNGATSEDMQFKLKDGSILKAKGIINGPNYYFLVARSKNKSTDFSKFFNGFALTEFNYANTSLYTDTALNFTVQTTVKPRMDTMIRSMIETVASHAALYNSDKDSYWPDDRYAAFKNDTTGEAVFVTIETFPKYYFSKDTADFWDKQIKWKKISDEYILRQKDYFIKDSTCGYTYTLLDTNSTKKILGKAILKDNKLYKLITLTDSVHKESSFINQFFSTFQGGTYKNGSSVFVNKLDSFFADYYSSDSTTHQKAVNALSYINYGPEGLGKLKEAISKLKLGDKDYFDLKSRFINEVGYIDDSCCVNKTINYLKELYNQVGDTSTFQNPVLNALARIQTKESYKFLKEMLLQDPPVKGENDEDDIFSLVSDSLPLAKTLFPEILQLASLDDYKTSVNDLLKDLVDSGYIKAADYADYYTKLYFDAKVELKKQQSRDEKILEKETNKDGDEETKEDNYNYRNYGNYVGNADLDDYSTLLMPFYDKYPAVSKFFEKIMQSKDLGVRLNAAIIMIQNNKKIPDTTLMSIAVNDKYRCKLLARLEDIDKTNLFPSKYKTQEEIAKSILLNDKSAEKFNSIITVGKQYVELKSVKGYVYFFKYKLQKDDEWKLGISGVQPKDLTKVSSNEDLVIMTDKKFKDDITEAEQFQKKLKQLIFAKRKSAVRFFNDKDYQSMFGQRSYGADGED